MSDEWVLVPREPTEAMFSASSFQEWDTFEQEWRAMLDAAPQQADPVAWRDHVEQRLHTWRQRFVNRSGDQLALDDFMGKESIDDLIDYVCDEYVEPRPAAEVQRLRDALEDLLHHAETHRAEQVWVLRASEVADIARRALEGK